MATSATPALDRKDVVVASVYGRGHWLAAHLADQGWSVAVLDLTSALGTFSNEDFDGPFGLLETDLISGSQRSHWRSELGHGSSTQISNGFTLWMKDGPLEGHGALSTFLAQEHSLSISVRNYLHMVSDLSDARLKPERLQLAKLPYTSNWLVGFMHQVTSNTLVENHLALSSEHAAPFFVPYSVRHITDESHKTALKFLRDKKIDVLSVDSVSGFIPEGDEQVIVQTPTNKIIARSFVWTLSGAETLKVAKPLMRAFFPNGSIERTWVWRRFITEFDEQPTEVPDAFTILQDPHLPWTHTNVIAVRTAKKSWNCWLKLPVAKQADEKYLQEQADEISKVINQKLPWAGAKTSDSGVSSPEWSVFDSHQKQKLKSVFAKNVFLCSPEISDGVDPLSYMLASREVLKGLEGIRRVWDARQAKREAKELQRLEKQKAKEERMRGD